MTRDRWRQLARLIRRLDATMLALVVLLLTAGVFFIHGVGQKAGGSFARMWVKQIGWAFLGLISFCAVVLVDYRILGRWAWALYLLALALLVAVFPFGMEIHGARSWLHGYLLLQTATRRWPQYLCFGAL